MRISEILSKKEVTISFEVFPPKTSDDMEKVLAATRGVAALKPSFMSVTYGAGGGTSEFTAHIAADIQERYGFPMLAHLTCVSSTKQKVRDTVRIYQEKGIENILTLRGDIPKGGRICDDYHYAVELIEDVRSLGDFCLGGACYPEGHIESSSKKEDLRHLKEKVDAGLSFLTTQMFFDNNDFYNFLYRAKDIGIDVPILPGIMPITTARQLGRSVQMSGTSVPSRFRAIVDCFGDDPAAMKQAGIVYASEQITDLIANGITHIHVYSMNKPEIAAGIMANLSGIIGRSFGEKI